MAGIDEEHQNIGFAFMIWKYYFVTEQEDDGFGDEDDLDFWVSMQLS